MPIYRHVKWQDFIDMFKCLSLHQKHSLLSKYFSKSANSDVDECEVAFKEIKLEVNNKDESNNEVTILSMFPADGLPLDDIKQEPIESEEATAAEEVMNEAQLADVIANIKINVPTKMETIYGSIQTHIQCMQDRSDWLLSEHKKQRTQFNQLEQIYFLQNDAANQLQLLVEKGPLAVPNFSMDDICRSLLEREQTKQELLVKKAKVDELNKELNAVNYRLGQLLAQRNALERHAETCRKRARAFNANMFRMIDTLRSGK